MLCLGSGSYNRKLRGREVLTLPQAEGRLFPPVGQDGFFWYSCYLLVLLLFFGTLAIFWYSCYFLVLLLFFGTLAIFQMSETVIVS